MKNNTDEPDRPRSSRGVSQRRSAVVAVLLTFLSLMALPLWGEDLSAAGKQTKMFFKKSSFVAKVDLKTSAKYHVDPDGRPTQKKKQGKHPNRGIGQRDVAFPQGAGGRGIYIGIDESDREIKVSLSKKRGLTMHAVFLYIHYDRKLTAADVDPRAIARALAPFVEFEGLDVGSELADAIDSLAAPSSSSQPGDVPPESRQPSASRPTILSLSASADPAVVRPGDSVSLVLSFAVEAAGETQVPVIERRTVSLNGTALSGYPVESQLGRAGGSHTSRYGQPIPPSAESGSYEFRGEVCVGGDCITRTVTFEIRD